ILLPVLEAALRDKDVGVRILAPGVLAQLGPKAKSALPALLVALRDREIDVRIEVILALGELGPSGVDAVPALFRLASQPDFALLEPMVSVTLGALGPKAVPPLIQGLEDKDVQIRRMSAYAL